MAVAIALPEDLPMSVARVLAMSSAPLPECLSPSSPLSGGSICQWAARRWPGRCPLNRRMNVTRHGGHCAIAFQLPTIAGPPRQTSFRPTVAALTWCLALGHRVDVLGQLLRAASRAARGFGQAHVRGRRLRISSPCLRRGTSSARASIRSDWTKQVQSLPSASLRGWRALGKLAALSVITRAVGLARPWFVLLSARGVGRHDFLDLSAIGSDTHPYTSSRYPKDTPH